MRRNKSRKRRRPKARRVSAEAKSLESPAFRQRVKPDGRRASEKKRLDIIINTNNMETEHEDC